MSKLWKGVKKVFKKVKSAIKKVVKSKLFKYVAIAAAIYFGGAGLSSMMSGGTFSAGVGSAGASLSTAGSSLMSGNFSAAATSVGNAWGTAGTIGGGLGATGTMAQASTASSAFIANGGVSGIGATTVGGIVENVATPVVENTVKSTIGNAITDTTIGDAGVSTGLKPLMAGAGGSGISIGTAMLANTGVQAVSGYMDAREQEKQDEKDRKRKTYYGVNGYGETAEGGMPSLMIKPPSVDQVFNNTDQLTNHRYGANG